MSDPLPGASNSDACKGLFVTYNAVKRYFPPSSPESPLSSRKQLRYAASGDLHLHPTSGQRPGGEIVQVQQGMVGVPAGDSCVNHNHRLHEVTMARPCFAAPRSPAQLDTRTLLFSLFVLLKAVLIFLPKSYLSTSTCHYKSLDQTTNTPNHSTHTLQDGLPRDCRGLHGQRPEELDQVREEGGA